MAESRARRTRASWGTVTAASVVAVQAAAGVTTAAAEEYFTPRSRLRPPLVTIATLVIP